MRYLILLLSFFLCSPVWATVGVQRYPSGTPVQVCQPSDTNTNCGGGGSSGLTIGTTPIVSGTNTYLEYNNNGKLGEIPQSTFVTGTPWTSTTLLLNQTTPQTIINGTPIIPSINGSSAANGSLTLQGTSNATRTASYLNLQPNGGNVGIGTSSPAGKLDVNGNGIFATYSNIGYQSYSSGWAGNGFSFTYSGTPHFSLVMGGDNRAYFGNGETAVSVMVLGLTGTANTNFYTPDNTNVLSFNGSTHATTFTGGNVGIGTTSPGAGLDMGASNNIRIPVQKSASGQRFVCIDSNGQLVSSVTACVGT